MATHYRVRQKLVAIGDDFWIENESGERAYRVDGKALRLRKTLVFEESAGTNCARSRSASCGSETAWRSRTGRSAIGNGQEGAHRATAGSVLEGSTPSFLDQEPRR
jgi:hypothetical protein